MKLNLSKLSSLIFKDQNTVVSGFDYLEVSKINKKTKKSVYWLKSLDFYEKFDNCFLVLDSLTFSEIHEQKIFNETISHLISIDNVTPRLAYSILLNECLEKKVMFDETKKHKKNKKIKIHGSVFIFNDVEIGDGTIIYPNVVIHQGVRIGKNCIIRENSSLGTTGMGFEKDLNGNWFHFPQVGGLLIGDDVEIGSHSDIKRGAIDDTILGNNCKLGSYINIGHNCVIGNNCLFTNQCVVSGSVKIGNNFFMGVNSSIRNGVKIGNDVTVAANVFVNKDVEDGTLTFGVSKK